ncbi:MAG: type II secretion system F family protein [Candidatus Poseidoniaceae archaeon]|nr:type II secretion system F family protein [Candidatus Poseidoniaceae archaeon]
MDLTTWQRICNRILGGVLKSKARDDKKLSSDLIKAQMPMMPEVFLATTIVTSFAIMAISWAFVAIFFIPDIGVIAYWEGIQDPATELPCYEWEYWYPELIDESKPGKGCPDFAYQVFPPTLKIVIILVGGLLIPYFGYKHNKGGAARQAKARGDMIEKYLPYAASYTAAMSAANATPAKIFRSLAMNKEIYADVSDDAGFVYRDVTLLGYDLITAMKMGVDRAASVWMTEFFQGMVGTLTAGGQLKLFFLNRAEHYMRENRTRLGMFLESIALLAESYIVVAVAMPLFLIVMLVIMFWVSGSGAQMSEGMLYGIVLGFIPMIHIAYAILVWTSSKEQEM